MREYDIPHEWRKLLKNNDLARIFGDITGDGHPGEAGGGGALGVGTTTPTRGAKLGVVGDVAVSNTVGTTTLMLHTEEALFGTCIQMRASNGAMLRIYATSTSAANTSKGTFTPLVVEAGYCEKTLTSDVN